MEFHVSLTSGATVSSLPGSAQLCICLTQMQLKAIEKRNTFTPQGKVSRMAPGAAGLDDAWAAG